MKEKVLLFAIAVFFISFNRDPVYSESRYLGKQRLSNKDFEGDWSSKNYSKIESLNIHLHQKNDSIKGSFCATMNYGKLLDCDPDDSNEIGIRGKVSSSKIALIKIRNESDSVGTAKLTLLNKTTIKWEMIKAPNGICNIPTNIILYRIVK